MVWVVVFVAAVLFGLGILAEERATSRSARFCALAIGVAFSIPGLLFVVYYAHVFDSADWFYEFRAMLGSELAACGLGFIAGYLHSFLQPGTVGERVAIPAAALALLVIPHSKPWLAPIGTASLSDRCEGEVCLQSTLSTCGPGSAATLLKLLGQSASERELAAECHTYRGGTEVWYLARAFRRRGFHTSFLIGPASPNALPSPAIAGVVLAGGPLGGAAGHFIAVLSQTPGRVVIADPMKGKLVLDRADLSRRYRFTGFFLVVDR